MDVVDAESLDDCAEAVYKTRRKWTDRAFNKDITERDGCGHTVEDARLILP